MADHLVRGIQEGSLRASNSVSIAFRLIAEWYDECGKPFTDVFEQAKASRHRLGLLDMFRPANSRSRMNRAHSTGEIAGWPAVERQRKGELSGA